MINIKKYYVSTNGNDKNDGSEKYPLKTVSAAFEKTKEDVEIIIENGCYNEYKTWNITGSNITIRAKSGTNPIISGGINITGWKPAGDSMIPGLLCADLPQEISYARNFYVNSRRAVRVHGEKTPNKGWELLDDPHIRFYGEIGKESNPNDPKQTKAVYSGYLTDHTEMLNWRNPGDIEFVYTVGWTHCYVPVDGITKEGDGAFVKMRMPCFRNCQIKGGVSIGSPNYIESAYELLSTPGQWYIDRSKRKIYYLPLENEDMQTVDCVLPLNEKFIDILGTKENPCENIKIEGINFEYSSWMKPSYEGHADIQANMTTEDGKTLLKAPGAVSISKARHLIFKDCKFSKIGSCAIDINTCVSDVMINGCTFEDISAIGVQFGGFNEKDAHPEDERDRVSRITVKNNYFCCIGTEYYGSPAIYAGYVSDTDIVHNEICHTSYTGISVGTGWGSCEPYNDTSVHFKDTPPPPPCHKPTVCMRNRIMYNHIHNVMEKLHDGAGIYTLGLQNGSLIKGNYIHDNAYNGEKTEENEVVMGYEGYGISEIRYIGKDMTEVPTPKIWEVTNRNGAPGGIYLDEASGGFYVSENAVHSVAIPFFLHDTGIKHRRHMNFIFDNYFNVFPEDDGFPLNIVENAGIKKYT